MAIEFNTLVCYIKNMSTVASLLPQDEQAIITHYCVCFRCQFEKRQAKKKLKTLLTFTEKILKVCSSLENYTTYCIALLNFFFFIFTTTSVPAIDILACFCVQIVLLYFG